MEKGLALDPAGFQGVVEVRETSFGDGSVGHLTDVHLETWWVRVDGANGVRLGGRERGRPEGEGHARGARVLGDDGDALVGDVVREPAAREVGHVDADLAGAGGPDDRAGGADVLDGRRRRPGDGALVPAADDAVGVERDGRGIGEDGVRALEDHRGAEDGRAAVEVEIEAEKELGGAVGRAAQGEERGEGARGGGGSALEDRDVGGGEDEAAGACQGGWGGLASASDAVEALAAFGGVGAELEAGGAGEGEEGERRG
jgi:hypothetical protein